MISNITKTTAITNSKQSLKADVDDINVNVGLPKIGNVKTSHLAAIDDDNDEDYDERMPTKPKNIRRTPTEDGDSQANLNGSIQRIDKQRSRERDNPSTGQGKSSSLGPGPSSTGKHTIGENSRRAQQNKHGSMLPQVSSRSRISLEELHGNPNGDAYSSGEQNRQLKVSGLA